MYCHTRKEDSRDRFWISLYNSVYGAEYRASDDKTIGSAFFLDFKGLDVLFLQKNGYA